MGLLNNTPQEYYNGNDYGNYQFTSLEDIINQFMVVYVGEDKIIPKARRLDVAFHAQRGLAELSFDTLKSCKAQEITVPASLQMILPHDYVNYTKISWVDSAGIKHLLYPTSKTSNPTIEPITNASSDYTLQAIGAQRVPGESTKDLILDGIYTDISVGMHVSGVLGIVPDSVVVGIGLDVTNTFTIVTMNFSATVSFSNGQTFTFSNADGSMIVKNEVEFSVPGWGADLDTNYIYDKIPLGLDISAVKVGMEMSMEGFPAGTIVTGINPAPTTSSLSGITSQIQYIFLSKSCIKLVKNKLATFTTPSTNSTTWSNYKSGTPSENQDDYQDDTYWPMDGSRFGLDPQHAQANGSFYIDCVSGKIHFSSNIAGKTVILDYISDSLGTDDEMQVHKFAEEAMYKWIAHAIMAGRANIPEYQVNRFKKERFAAIRTAKLRLSNLKLEELTQILRGKSKQIKH